ncbi:MAG: zinc metallopeptidase [Oscillospiraceae bacterium]|jgi:Zn-dependent membrane protease YugP|nr:zinc metallopeptidase [Oscillospiraceae bacterium]
MPFYYDTIYWIVLIPVLILSVYAQIKVSSTFNRYGKAANRRRITGAQAAYEVLRSNGVTGVDIRPCSGSLTDHYDPRSNTIYLSQPVYNAATVSAVGVAAHEAGHAVQYAQAYGPIQVRSAIIPVTQFGSKFAFIALMLGLVLYSQPVFALGIALFGLTALFQLVTLPVEFNASARALRTIDGALLLDEEERRGAKRVLTAAALTYVAALLMSLVQLLRYLLIFASRGGNRRD